MTHNNTIEKEIREAYTGILSEDQIEATICWWQNKAQDIRTSVLIEAIKTLDSLKTDERKIAEFGEWQAKTYEEKMLVNGVLAKAKSNLFEAIL